MQKLPTYLRLSALALLIYMPFHLFLSRWLSLYTGGLGVWDAGKDILTVISLLAALVIGLQQRLYRNPWIRRMLLAVAAYGLLHLFFLIWDRDDQDLWSLLIATLYNGRLFAYLIIGLVVGLTQTNKVREKRLIQILLVVSTVTCLIALAQWVLPKDLMTHFGYSIERGVKAAFFIDDNPEFPRIMSTIRDPNSYGAFLVVPITLLWLLVLKKPERRRIAASFLGLHLAALWLTHSRGAWLGAIVSLIVITTSHMHHFKLAIQNIWRKLRQSRLLFALLFSCVIMFAAYAAQQADSIGNILLHSAETTQSADPNELRLQFLIRAVRAILAEPLGHGPGTAGLVAISHPQGGILTENYFLQIAYEAGVVGLALYLYLLYLTYRSLTKATQGYLSPVLAASFWGYMLISMLIHLWSNEAVAAQWWLVSGLIIGHSFRKRSAQSGAQGKTTTSAKTEF